MRPKASSQSTNTRTCLTVLGVLLIGSMVVLCVVSVALYNRLNPRPAETLPGTLRLAYSPEKQALFEELVRQFNASGARLPSGGRASVQAESVTPETMLEVAHTNAYQALSPDSSIWLSEIDRRWAQEHDSDAVLVGDHTRYMISPVVIAMWQDVAESLGYPERALGWEDLLRAADGNPTFRWSHASTHTASGLLATLAQFYAGAGLTRGLTEQDATSESTLAYVTRLSRTVKHYGEGELAVMQQVEERGRDFLDAFVVQEQLVVQYNLAHGGGLVAVYPAEGTMWEDHPLALLEHPDLTEDQRRTYALFREFLLSPATQALILQFGYRPADLTIPLDGPESPIRAENGVDPDQPYTTLQIPSPAVIDVVRNAWLYTKRHTNIYLVVDLSGSMEGEKLEEAREALRAFLDQIQSDERVGLVLFHTTAMEAVSLTEMGDGRDALVQTVDRMSAGGNTAMLDGVALSFDRLRALNDTERINAIVVMTDGQENASRVRLEALTEALRESAASDLPVVVFCVAYGQDADYRMLDQLAEASGGMVRESDPETIRDLYRTLSTYF